MIAGPLIFAAAQQARSGSVNLKLSRPELAALHCCSSSALAAFAVRLLYLRCKSAVFCDQKAAEVRVSAGISSRALSLLVTIMCECPAASLASRAQPGAGGG